MAIQSAFRTIDNGDDGNGNRVRAAFSIEEVLTKVV